MLNRKIEAMNSKELFQPAEVNQMFKLKDLIETYLNESIEDLKEAVKNNPELIDVITKYNNMLINIKYVCQCRNKF